jgi:cyclopropane-fatty-acyl-phospholipid synthase
MNASGDSSMAADGEALRVSTFAPERAPEFAPPHATSDTDSQRQGTGPHRTLRSAIYEGRVRHRRFAPRAHAFEYRIAQLYLDLDELDRVFDGRRLWSVDRRNLAEFRRSDYHGDAATPLADAVRATVERALGRRPQGPIRLLTHLRYAGFAFNPVSFYYCYAADGETLDCIVAEITNTPWRERHAYVLDVDRAEPHGRALHWSFDKCFHVSPFMAMDRRYDWRFIAPGDELRVHMDVLRSDGAREFDATLTLERRALDAANLRRVLWRYPLMTAKVVGAIHWQALRLWLKRTPVYEHPKPSLTSLAETDKHHDAASIARVDASGYGALDRFLRERLLAQMARLRHGRIVLHDALGTTELGEPGADLELRIEVYDPGFYRAVAANGSVGSGEAYMDGYWRCDPGSSPGQVLASSPGQAHASSSGRGLVDLVRLLVRNRDLLDGMETGLARFGGMAMRAWHALRRNTRDGSRRNIAAHYDLGNEFFELFLSSDLMYSAAVWADDEDDTLEAASTRKLDRICRKLALSPGDRVIEIGTGWGGFALHAAKHYGCHVTTTTISHEQHALAAQRIAEAGLSDRVTLLREDYRDLRGTYDKLVSIEMIEAIGAQYLDTYFGKLGALLEPDGLGLIQAITIEDHRYRQALDSVDFIKRHVFPGSFIPSIAAMLAAKTRASDLALIHLEDFGLGYARTLEAWRQRFLAALPQVRAQGYDERFVRMWEFYLAYCEGGFRERSIGVPQLLLAKPGHRGTAPMPELRYAPQGELQA